MAKLGSENLGAWPQAGQGVWPNIFWLKMSSKMASTVCCILSSFLQPILLLEGGERGITLFPAVGGAGCVAY